MRNGWTRWLAAATCAAVLGSTAAATSAGAAIPRQSPSDEYCEALQTNYAVSILIGFISAFSDIGNDASGGEPVDKDEIRGTFLLVLSPALEGAARELAKGGSKKLRKSFTAQAEVFAKGVDILQEDAGVTDEQIDALRDFNVSSTDANVASDLETVFEDNDIDEDEVKALGKDFAGDLDDTGQGVGRKQRQEFGRLGARCGVTPSTEIDCEELVAPEEATAALGVDATRDDGETCSYLGPDPDSGLQPELAVDVYDTSRAFERITGAATESQPLDGVGDEAIAFDGFSARGGIKTCGRTLVAKGDDTTIVVALCLPEDADVSDDALVELGTQVLDRLG